MSFIEASGFSVSLREVKDLIFCAAHRNAILRVNGLDINYTYSIPKGLQGKFVVRNSGRSFTVQNATVIVQFYPVQQTSQVYPLGNESIHRFITEYENALRAEFDETIRKDKVGTLAAINLKVAAWSMHFRKYRPYFQRFAPNADTQAYLKFEESVLKLLNKLKEEVK